ncbi:MAG: hypothetical protein NZM00_04560, partial [Anaerolinea sp.]|nr:hypothetical protein [Anaerolinea sp.]
MIGKKHAASDVPPALIWTTDLGWKPGSHLHTPDGEIVGRLITRQRRWWRAPVYEIDAPGSRWRFQTVGTRQRRIVITTAADDEPAAEFHFNAREDGGQLIHAGGTSYTWRRGDFWGDIWLWLDGAGTSLIRFTVRGGLRLRAEVALLAGEAPAKTPGLLIFLGWF